MTRRRFERGVFIIAALASIATSPKHWRVDATVPAIPDPTRTTRVVVQASQPPIIDIATATGIDRPNLVELGHGSYEILVAPGTRLASAYLDGRCHMHLMCGDDCTIPEGTAISITSVKPVATWRVEVSTPEQHLELDPMAYSTSVSIALSSSRPARVTVDTDVPTSSAFADNLTAEIMWSGARTKTPVRWTAHLAIEGPCPTDAPCEPPPDAHLSITKITVHSDVPQTR